MNLKLTHSIRKKLQGRRYTCGSWLTIGSPIIAELMASCGFDWIAIDMEHSVITVDTAQDLIRIIESAQCVPLVRVTANDPALIKRVMDAGAHGVIVPMINSIEDAEHAVQAVCYPPRGTRGVGLARAQGYGFGFKIYREWVEKQPLVIAQIEHIDAVENLADILSVKGVDGTLIGPYDLSASMGAPGEFARPAVRKALDRYKDVCTQFKKPMGVHVIQPEAKEIKRHRADGFTFIAFSLDTLFLGTKIHDEMKKL